MNIQYFDEVLASIDATPFSIKHSYIFFNKQPRNQKASKSTEAEKPKSTITVQDRSNTTLIKRRP